MITKEYRPQTFSDVVGQDLPKELLKAIIKNPKTAPKSIILEGNYGTGKTSLARVFAKGLNCKHLTKDIELCCECDICKSNIDSTIYYDEYDSAMIGNVNDIKELTNTFYFDSSLGYKVICLDESHLISSVAQASLLKVIEESNQSIFFLFCTTDIDKVLPTIQSRSMILNFNLIPPEQTRLSIEKILNEKGISISNETLNSIVDRSQGHLRNAHLLLDECLLLGEDKFNQLVKSAKELYYKLIISAMRRDTATATKIIECLSSIPLHTLKLDYEQTVLDLIKVGLRVETTNNKFISAIVSSYNEKIFNLIDILNNNDIYDTFTSDKRFKAGMWVLFERIILQQK